MNNFEDHLVLAPIRGITNFIYRNAINRSFGGIDSTIAPYIVTKESGELNQRQLNDVDYSINDLPTEGQVLTKDVGQFLAVAHHFCDLGVKKINLNMGCPYPMVANRKKGSGLLSNPDKVRELLSGIKKDCPLPFSIKVRLGREKNDEIHHIIPIANELEINEVTIHARLGKQIYKGNVDLDGFESCLDLLPNSPCYNGDIKTIADFHRVKKRFPMIKKWMIGRGALANPALFTQIKGQKLDENQYISKLFKMHNEVAKGHLEYDNGRSDFLNKMKGQWLYFSESFDNKHKVFKKVKKARSIDEYYDVVDWIFDQDINESVLNY